MNIKIQNLKFEEAAKIKEEIDLFSAIVKKQKHLLNLNRDIVFWIKIKDYKYKIYYITSFEINYEKICEISKSDKKCSR